MVVTGSYFSQRPNTRGVSLYSSSNKRDFDYPKEFQKRISSAAREPRRLLGSGGSSSYRDGDKVGGKKRKFSVEVPTSKTSDVFLSNLDSSGKLSQVSSSSRESSQGRVEFLKRESTKSESLGSDSVGLGSVDESSFSVESLRRSCRGLIPKKVGEDFICGSIPVLKSSDKEPETTVSLRDFFESSSEGWEYKEGLEFQNLRVKQAFHDQWRVLMGEKMKEQKRDDPELVQSWRSYFRGKKSGKIDPLDLPLTIRPAEDPGMGLGVFAVEDLPRGFLLGEYSGVVTKLRNQSGGYVFNLSQDSGMSSEWCYDALLKRNHTAFFNHSENPNVDCYEYYDELGPHIVFYVGRPIFKGDELKINYGVGYAWGGKKIV